MAPFIIKCRELPADFKVKVCVTGRHKEMLHQVLEFFFEIVSDTDLAGMKQNQTLFDITANTLTSLEDVLGDDIDFVIVQGDTTSAFVGALAAFYKKIKVVHLEAGLRSDDMFSPFPEEANRSLVGRLADTHFTLTAKASENF